MPRSLFTLVCLLLFFKIPANSASIKGKIILDDSWAPVVYISVIEDFKDLQTASYDFLRYQIELDSTGYFEVNNMNLAEGDRIYRLHICKKGDPVSTIIIGGQEENFIHFLMNNETELLFSQTAGNPAIQNISINGYHANNSLTKLFDLQKLLNTPPELPSAQNRKFLRSQVLSDFKSIADTASNAVIRLLALYLIDESFTVEQQMPLMEKIESELVQIDHSSPYFIAFREKIRFLQFQSGQSAKSPNSWLKWLSLFLLIPLVILFLWREIKRPKVSRRSRTGQKVQTLSNQEKKVFNLLKKGKSNKEISSELHIEVSTVKSHLNKIYSRLGVKSRRDIVDKDW